MRLTEDVAKARLAALGVPVPLGAAAGSPGEAVKIAVELGDSVMVKALVPANRRGRAGGVLGPVAADDAAEAAEQLLGASVAGFATHRVYVEKWLPLTSELYLAFSFSTGGPTVTASNQGGVDVEATLMAPGDEAAVSRPMDLLAGISAEQADDLWRLAGADPTSRDDLVKLTLAAAAAFADDAVLLELNPVATIRDGGVMAVGALIELDDASMFRHREITWSPYGLTAREAAVAEADLRLPGPSVRYVELSGDIGLLVGGGGAGLYQHDLLAAAGASAANHSDMGAGASAEKLDVLIDAILGHPELRRLLVGFNVLQMARCDLIMERLLPALDRAGFGDGSLPIVVRLEGLGAARARELASGRHSLTYLAPGATLAEAVAAVTSGEIR